MKILNERQYRITKAACGRFARTLEEFDRGGVASGISEGMHPLARQAMRDSLVSQVQVLNRQLEEYEAERSSPCLQLPVNSLNDLPEILIRSRISARMTQKDLATHLNLKEQQIQRWEQTRYKGVAWERLQDVLQVLDVRVAGEAQRAHPIVACAAD